MSSHPDQTLARHRRPLRRGGMISAAGPGVWQQAGHIQSEANGPTLSINLCPVSITAEADAAATARPKRAGGGETASTAKWWQFSRDGRRFAERRSVNLPLLAVIIGVHVVMLSLLAANQMRVAVKPTRTLVVFDVKLIEAPPALPPEPVAKTVAETPKPVVDLPPIVAAAAAPLPIVVHAEQPAVPPPAPSPGPSLPAPPTTVAGNDLTTTLLSAAPPRYPLESRRKHEQGTVVLAVVVGTDGRVATISVHRSSGFQRLDAAALSAVKRWRWSPRIVNGAPVQVAGLVPMPFELKQP